MATKLTYECTSDYHTRRIQMLDLVKREYVTVKSDLYDSLYLDNPYGLPLLGLCSDGEVLVGQENYIRQDIGCAGTVYKGALGINTLVDSRYRVFYGVFGKLCKLTIDEMRPRVDLLCAFANEDSKKYYLKYFQWKIASKIQVYKKATKPSGLNRETFLSFIRPGRPHSDVILEETSQFESHILDPIINSCLANSTYRFFFKTSAFLNWKFLNNRHFDVTGYYVVRNGRVCGYCTTHRSGSENKVVDIVVENDDIQIFEKTLSCLSHLTRNHGMNRLVIYATPGCWYERALKRHFFFRRWEFDFITHTYSKAIPDANWIIHIGDFDIF